MHLPLTLAGRVVGSEGGRRGLHCRGAQQVGRRVDAVGAWLVLCAGGSRQRQPSAPSASVVRGQQAGAAFQRRHVPSYRTHHTGCRPGRGACRTCRTPWKGHPNSSARTRSPPACTPARRAAPQAPSSERTCLQGCRQVEAQGGSTGRQAPSARGRRCMHPTTKPCIRPLQALMPPRPLTDGLAGVVRGERLVQGGQRALLELGVTLSQGTTPAALAQRADQCAGAAGGGPACGPPCPPASQAHSLHADAHVRGVVQNLALERRGAVCGDLAAGMEGRSVGVVSFARRRRQRGGQAGAGLAAGLLQLRSLPATHQNTGRFSVGERKGEGGAVSACGRRRQRDGGAAATHSRLQRAASRWPSPALQAH